MFSCVLAYIHTLFIYFFQTKQLVLLNNFLDCMVSTSVDRYVSILTQNKNKKLNLKNILDFVIHSWMKWLNRLLVMSLINNLRV